MGSQLLRPLSIGEILDGAFTLYRRHFTALVGTAFGILIPVLLLSLFAPIATNLVNTFLSLAAMGACIWLSSEAILGNTLSPKDGAQVGFRRMFPLFGWGILYGIAVALGILALVVPGVLLWIMWFAVWPIVVIERVSPFGRSRDLAKDEWGKIFVVGLVGVIIVFMPQFLVFLGGVGVFGLDRMVSETEIEPAAVLFAQTLAAALSLPFTAAVQTLLYYDQRVRKEGFDVAHTAASLDRGSAAAGEL